MNLKLPIRVSKRLRSELKRAGRFEIGGILVGEQLEPNIFRVVEISVQEKMGSVSHFVRDPEHYSEFMAGFYERTGHGYQKYNYLGEWHSHPSFSTTPSIVDVVSAQRIADDPTMGVNFVVLVVCRIRFWGRLELSATVFRAGTFPEPVKVEVEGRLPLGR